MDDSDEGYGSDYLQMYVDNVMVKEGHYSTNSLKRMEQDTA